MGQRTDSSGLQGRGPRLVQMDVKVPSATARIRQENGAEAEGLMDSGTFTHFNTWLHNMSPDLGVNE